MATHGFRWGRFSRRPVRYTTARLRSLLQAKRSPWQRNRSRARCAADLRSPRSIHIEDRCRRGATRTRQSIGLVQSHARRSKPKTGMQSHRLFCDPAPRPRARPCRRRDFTEPTLRRPLMRGLLSRHAGQSAHTQCGPVDQYRRCREGRWHKELPRRGHGPGPRPTSEGNDVVYGWLGDLDSNQGCPGQSREFYR